jgi:hypothetical protein
MIIAECFIDTDHVEIGLRNGDEVDWYGKQIVV